MPLDANEQHPRLWAALLAGAGLGLAWGVAARVWMRLIATRPSFTITGTAFILGAATVFGICAGLAYAVRKRGWRGWRHYAARTAAVVTFLPFGVAGGTPLMVTVLLTTLALTQPVLVIAWVLSVPAVLFGTVGPGHWLVAVLPPTAAAALAAWKWAVARAGDDHLLRRADPWVDRALRAAMLLVAAWLFGQVAWEILTDKPGLRSPLYVLIYLVLLYPLFLALRVGLLPLAQAGAPAWPETAADLTVRSEAGG